MKIDKSFVKFIKDCIIDSVYNELEKNLNDVGEIHVTEDLEHLVKENYIYMDTCSFMYYNTDKFLIKIVPLLERWNKKIYTFSCCIREINKHINGNDKEKYEGALRAKSFIGRLKKSNLLQVIDYSDDIFADPDFLSYFIKKRINEKILFITQDGDLSIDAYRLNEQKSIKGQFITVKSIDKYGNLCDNYQLSDYMDEENEESDDDFYSYTERENVNFFNNNSGGTNISAYSIDKIVVNDRTIQIDEYQREKEIRGSFWYSIY